MCHCGASFKRRGEGLGQCVLGRRHVAVARREKGNELAVTPARDLFGYIMRPNGPHFDGATLAPGQRAAQEIAWSRSGTSMM